MPKTKKKSLTEKAISGANKAAQNVKRAETKNLKKKKVTHPKQSTTYTKTFKGRNMGFPLSSTPNLKQ